MKSPSEHIWRLNTVKRVGGHARRRYWECRNCGLKTTSFTLRPPEQEALHPFVRDLTCQETLIYHIISS